MMNARNVLIFAVTVILTASPSFAGWELVHEEAEEQVFLLPESVNKAGPSSFKFWTLLNSKGQMKKGEQVRSSKVQMELSCSRVEIRITYIANYSENMGKGKQLQAFEVPKSAHDFQPVIPGENHDAIYRRVCKR